MCTVTFIYPLFQTRFNACCYRDLKKCNIQGAYGLPGKIRSKQMKSYVSQETFSLFPLDRYLASCAEDIMNGTLDFYPHPYMSIVVNVITIYSLAKTKWNLFLILPFHFSKCIYSAFLISLRFNHLPLQQLP